MKQCKYLSVYSIPEKKKTGHACNHPDMAKCKPGRDYDLLPDLNCKPGKCKDFVEVGA